MICRELGEFNEKRTRVILILAVSSESGCKAFTQPACSPGENVAAQSRERPAGRGAHADFRWEIYDLFNAKTWNNPQLDLSNADFGKIFNASGNRTMQLGLKLVF